MQNATEDLKDIAEKLVKYFYVDNCLTGVDTEGDQECFINQGQELLLLGMFNLRNRFGNRHFELIDRNESQQVFGLKWNCSEDTLFCSTKIPNILPE